MKKTALLVSIMIAFFGMKAFAQPDGPQTGYKLPVTVIGKDTLPVYVMEDVQHEEKIDENTFAQQKEWRRMVHDVLKVYPYAADCARKLKQIDEQMAAMGSNKEKKQFLKEEERKLKEQYEAKLKDLNYRQGKLLVKLVDRQTGRSSYSLIKDYKNGVQAMFWQGFAGMFGMSLKERYDPQKEPLLEAVIKYLDFQY